MPGHVSMSRISRQSQSPEHFFFLAIPFAGLLVFLGVPSPRLALVFGSRAFIWLRFQRGQRESSSSASAVFYLLLNSFPRI